MGARCASCNSRSRAELRSSDCQRPIKHEDECWNTNTPTVVSTLLPKQSYNSAGSNPRDDSSKPKQTQQDCQNTQSQETMPSAPTIVSDRIQPTAESENNNIQSTLHKPMILGDESQFSDGTSTGECQQSIYALKSSIYFVPLTSEKPPQRMQSEPSIGRPSLNRSHSAPSKRNGIVSYSAPPTRHQSVSEIQLEMAIAPLRFSAPAKTPPPSNRRTSIGKLFTSFSRKKEGERNKAQYHHKSVISTVRDEVEKANFKRVGSSTEMGSLTESTSLGTNSKKEQQTAAAQERGSIID